MATKTEPHWYYPSGIIPCGAYGGRIDDLVKLTGVVTHLREDVACSACKVHLEEAKERCARCRGESDGPHTCDPAG